MRTIFVHLMCVFALGAPPGGTADDAETRPLPGAIDAADDLRRYLETMFQRSATFRRQCRRLDVPGLRVHIRRDPQLANKPYRALTTIRRSADVMVASVAVTAFGDPTEWLAHELEHVIEQIDGVDLPWLTHANQGAWQAAGGTFETMRAIRAGELVRQEVRDRRHALARAAAPPERGRGDD